MKFSKEDEFQRNIDADAEKTESAEIYSRIAKFSIPLTIKNIFNCSHNIVSFIILAKYYGAVQIAAKGVGEGLLVMLGAAVVDGQLSTLNTFIS